MSEPIMELIDSYRFRCVVYGPQSPQARSEFEAIEREVAALRKRVNLTLAESSLKIELSDKIVPSPSDPVLDRSQIAIDALVTIRDLRSENERMRNEIAALRERAEQSPDANVEAVRAMLLERSRVGLSKYGVTTERGDLSITDWLRHMQQEMLDGAVYAETAIKRIADLEAERAALMAAGEAMLAAHRSGEPEDMDGAWEIFDGQPGALAAWMARKR